jgi:hypothetical protein
MFGYFNILIDELIIPVKFSNKNFTKYFSKMLMEFNIKITPNFFTAKIDVTSCVVLSMTFSSSLNYNLEEIEN